MVYRYKTSCCTFVLRQLSGGEWGIFIGDNDMCYNASSSPQTAICEINAGQTGCEAWDDERYTEEEVPDIREWEIIG